MRTRRREKKRQMDRQAVKKQNKILYYPKFDQAPGSGPVKHTRRPLVYMYSTIFIFSVIDTFRLLGIALIFFGRRHFTTNDSLRNLQNYYQDSLFIWLHVVLSILVLVRESNNMFYVKYDSWSCKEHSVIVLLISSRFQKRCYRSDWRKKLGSFLPEIWKVEFSFVRNSLSQLSHTQYPPMRCCRGFHCWYILCYTRPFELLVLSPTESIIGAMRRSILTQYFVRTRSYH
jgi:hypothetical protein